VGEVNGPQTEAAREGVKSYVEVLKHFGTLSGAAAVAVAGFQEQLDLDLIGTAVSLVTLGLSFAVALLGVMILTYALAHSDRSKASLVNPWGYRFMFFSGILLFSGVGSFMLNSWGLW
jgi:hypothetical protein